MNVSLNSHSFILLGENACGKTCSIKSLLEDEYEPTIFLNKFISLYHYPLEIKIESKTLILK